MGDGIGFIPISDIITQVFSTKRAIGLTTGNGLETVELEGESFDTIVEIGDKVI